MKALVTVVVLGDDGLELVGAHHEEVIVTTRDPEDNYLRAGALLERTVPATHQQVRDQLTAVHEELAEEKRQSERAALEARAGQRRR